ncbi:MAG: PAS domain-containing protein [Acidobacteria bacterium]|nr:PAS domain-containing protein [Acidobacteriota bacterium]
MTRAGYLLLGLTAIVGVLAGVIAFALMQFVSAARNLRRGAKEQGGETVFMAAAVEEAVNKLRQQERAMSLRAEASERLSGQIIANLTSGLLVVGEEGRVETLNPAGRRLLGMPDADWTGHYRDVLAGAAPLAGVIEECMTSAHPIVRRAIRVGRGGTTHLGVTVSPMREGHGPVQGAVCLFSDLSAVVELEEQLRLKDSLARLGELTAGLAHEFRNGLATIHGYARLLDPERMPAEFKPYVGGLRAETDSLREVVTNFLNFAKPAQLTLGPVDMRTIAERAAEDVRGEVASRGGAVRAAGAFADVLGDEVLLRQAFSNLCRNALEACAEADRTPRIAIHSSVDAQAGVLRLVVSDNGPGIDPALGDRVFQPFVTGRSRGTGLGLALVQKIIVTHNGRITAGRSEAGGAAFHVALPLAAPGASTAVT